MCSKGVPGKPADEAPPPTREQVSDGWIQWAGSRGFVPQSFWTLTFDEERIGRVSADRALAAWRWLVRVLNEKGHGRRYRQWCKHSAWSYIVGVDYSRLGAVHLHAVVDGWVDFGYLHAVWNKAYGFSWITRVEPGEDVRVAIAHVVKYATKGSDRMSWWFNRSPRRLPPSGVSAGAYPGGACQATSQIELPGILGLPTAAPAGAGGDRGLTGARVR